jgi:hypothetical protein
LTTAAWNQPRLINSENLKILIIAVLIEEMLQSLGYHVVGPVSRLDAALRLAHEEPLDAAILDVGIRGGKVYPVAEELLARNIPLTSFPCGPGCAMRLHRGADTGGRNHADSDDFGQSFRAEVGHLFRLMSAGHSD